MANISLAPVFLLVVSFTAMGAHVVLVVVVVELLHQSLKLKLFYLLVVKYFLQRFIDDDLSTHELPESLLVLLWRNGGNLLGLLFRKLFGLEKVLKLFVYVIVAKVIDDSQMVFIPATVRSVLMP